jgi:aspartyl-tRNA(Asn)/glutamyl-tRNA(Gln) amidotransferase subunit C
MTQKGPEGLAMDVADVAHLARLRLSPEEEAVFGRQLDAVVGYVRKIRELDLSEVEPTSHAHAVQNVFREDRTAPGLDADAVRGNAPAFRDGHFIVPKIVE